MPLINSTTNLKSLKYGKDRPGGGDSGQPFIQVSPPQDRLNRTSQAGLQFYAAPTDFKRISKYFTTTKGLLFIANQNILSQTGVQTQTQRIPNEGVYIPTSTLAQVPLNRTGTYLIRNGFNPFEEIGAKSSKNNTLTYSGVVKNNQSVEDNRLVKLVKDKMYGDTGPIQEFTSNLQSTVNSIFGAINTVGNLLGINTSGIGKIQSKINKGLDIFSNPVLLSYPGGPGSALGIGKTNIFFADKRTVGRDDKTYLVGLENSPTDRTDLIGKRYTPSPKPTEPLQQKPFSRVSYNRSPGNTKDPNRKDPYITPAKDSKPLDRINALAIYKSESPTSTDLVNDFVKFRFAIIDNDEPNQKNYIHFRAFLNSFTDSYGAEWSGFRYPGRGEQLFKYGGFTREFSVSWIVYAQSKAELIPMYQKLNFLASSLTPDYGGENGAGFMRGNLVQLTVGGYLYEQPGIITSLTYTAPDDTPYEISVLNSTTDVSVNSDSSTKELPYRIDASINFIPIHTFTPQIQDTQVGKSRYIALADGSGKNNNYDTDPQLYNTFGGAFPQKTIDIPSKDLEGINIT